VLNLPEHKVSIHSSPPSCIQNTVFLFTNVAQIQCKITPRTNLLRTTVAPILIIFFHSYNNKCMKHSKKIMPATVPPHLFDVSGPLTILKVNLNKCGCSRLHCIIAIECLSFFRCSIFCCCLSWWTNMYIIVDTGHLLFGNSFIKRLTYHFLPVRKPVIVAHINSCKR